MKCPYIVNSVSIEVEPAGKELSKAIMFEQPIDCMQDQCAAWQNGHCVRTS